MKDFFGDKLLLNTPASEILYESVKDLPIVDYHCHLNEKDIRDNHKFADLGELWLAGDHYKWRAMRLCGVDEKYITGNETTFYEKYLKYAEIFPLLCGGPLYYWTQLELKMLFGVTEPFCSASAERIWKRANEVLKTLGAQEILKKFKVEYIATTDDPASPLSAHGVIGSTDVRPTFRPDFALNMDPAALERLETASGIRLATVADLKRALEDRLNFFLSKGCRIADHGMDFLPSPDCGDARAEELYRKRANLSDEERQILFSHLLCYLAGLYRKNGMVMQMHFATFRNVNSKLFPKCGKDAGFDIMRGEVNTDRLVAFLDGLNSTDRQPKIVLYTLNPACVASMATLTGAFPNVRVGAAWWFNDAVEGIRDQLRNVAEYAALGTNLGMLTDSRSLASYVRFDFFRRILADFVGGYVERGEYDLESAKTLMYRVCYGNVKEFLGL